MPGVVRTRVGYTGGAKIDPTYHSLGDHTETLQIDFDPQVVSYAALLDVFWKTHNPCAQAGSRQYMSAVFYYDAEQQRQVLATLEQEQARRRGAIKTMVLPAGPFYLAEDYHQKYLLRQRRDLLAELRASYPATQDLVASTAAARINGYLGGNGSLADLERELPSFGLSPEGTQSLRAAFGRRR